MGDAGAERPLSIDLVTTIDPVCAAGGEEVSRRGHVKTREQFAPNSVVQVAGDKAVRVPVKRLGGNEEQSVVDGAIDARRPLVTAGNYQLIDGAAVRTTDGAPEPPGK